jgi:thiol-disulfide isomerase/thioredoxin
MEDLMKQMKRNAMLVGTVMALFALMAMNVAAQDDKMMGDKMGGQMMDRSKPTVVIIRADWCGACQKLEPTLKELTEQYKDRLNFVVLDVTTDEKVAESAKKAEEIGISKFFAANKKNTSTVVVLGEKNKISFKTTHNYDREAYVRAFDEAIKKNSMMMKKEG